MDKITQAVKILKSGGVVVYPTDTAYGLAVDATNVKAINKLFALKGRDFKNPIHVIPPDSAWLKRIVKLDTQALKLMNKFLPGALTLVLPLKAKGPAWQKLSAGTKTLGIRMPNHKTALQLAVLFGKPITTTSANISGQGVCYSAREVREQFKSAKFQPDFYLDAGKLKKTKPSTVVTLIKGVKILRTGPINETQINTALK